MIKENVETAEGEKTVLELIASSSADSDCSVAEFYERQAADELLGIVCKALKHTVDSTEAEVLVLAGVGLSAFFFNPEGILRVNVPSAAMKESSSVLAVPAEFTPKLIDRHHSESQGCHIGFERLIHLLRAKYYWPYMTEEVAEAVALCQVCQQFKLGLASQDVPVGERAETYVGELTVMDICGPLKITSKGNCHVLCIMDYVSRYVRLCPITDCGPPKLAVAARNHRRRVG